MGGKRKKRKTSTEVLPVPLENKRPGFSEALANLDKRLVMAFLFVLAFILRLIYLNQIKNTVSFDAPLMDSLYYIKEAKRIAGGDLLGNKVFFMGPLYSYFLAVIIKIAGFDWYNLRFAQILVGSLNVLLIYRLAYKTSGKPLVALVAGIISAGYGTFIYYDANFLMAFFALFLYLLLLNLLISWQSYPGKGRIFGGGVLLGLAALARANILILAPAVLLLWWLKKETGPAGFYGGSVRFLNRVLVPFILGIALMIAPATLRNYLIEPEFVLITSNGGLNLYIGNNKDSKGIYIPLRSLRLPNQKSFQDRGREMDIEARELAQEAVGHPLSSAGTSRFWLNQAFSFIKNNPGLFLKNLAVKTALFLNGTEIPQIEDIYFNQRYSRLLSIPGFNASLIIPLGLFGMILSFPDRRKYGLIYFFGFSYMFSIVLFFVTARYRVPVMPVFILFAAVALVESWEKLQREPSHRLIWQGVFFLTCFLFSNWPMLRLDFAENYYNFGVIHYQKGEMIPAIDGFRRSLKIRPDYTDSYRGLGIIYRLKGDYGAAAEQFKRILDYNPENAEALFQMGISYKDWKKPAEAMVAFERAVRLDPNHAQALAEMGALYYNRNQFKKAEEYYRQSIATRNYAPAATYDLGILKMREAEFAQAIEYFLIFEKKFPKKIDQYLYYNLGNSYFQLKEWKKAEAAFKKSLTLDDRNPDAYRQLGNVYLETGSWKAAINIFQQALSIFRKWEQHLDLGGAFRAAGQKEQALAEYLTVLEKRPDDVNLMVVAGAVSLSVGRRKQALKYLEQALHHNPASFEANFQMGNLYRESDNPQKALDYYGMAAKLTLDPDRQALIEQKRRELIEQKQ